MDFSFTEEQSMLRDTVASYLADNYDFDKRRAALAKEPNWRPDDCAPPNILVRSRMRNPPEGWAGDGAAGDEVVSLIAG